MAAEDTNYYYTEDPSFGNFFHKYLANHSAADYFGLNTGKRLTSFVGDLVNGTLFDPPVESSAFDSSLESSDVSRTEALDNVLTGNVDFDRTKELMASEQAYNSQEAERQRQWYEQLSSTAYQRAAEDLKAAGYNPALLLGQASPAASAYGSAASIGSHSGGNSQIGASMLLGNVANAIVKVFAAAATAGTKLY